MTEPTDAEIRGLAATGNGVYQDDETAIWEITDPSLLKFASAVLSRWGQPAVAGAPVGYCHEIKWRVRQSEQVQKITRKAQPEYGYTQALYTTPQPTQVQPVGREPLTDEQIDAAAKKLAECMEYPWEFMPEPGRENMRKHAQDVIDAAHGIKGGQHDAE